MKLLGLRYWIIYKRGQDNRVADALWWQWHGATEELVAISVPTPAWLDEVLAGYRQDSQAQQMLTESLAGSPPTNFFVYHGVLRYKDRI